MGFFVFIGLLTLAVLYILIQWYLSLRPAAGWGLVLPLGFLALLVMSVLDLLPEIIGITYNAVARRIYSLGAILGLAVCLFIYVICRRVVKAREEENRRLYEAYLAAKRRKAAMEKKILGEE